MNIKYNASFRLESRKDKKGLVIDKNVPIRMRVTYAGNRIEFATGYRIDASKWDTELQRVRSGCSNKLKQTASEINADLQKYESDLKNIFKSFEVREENPTVEQIKEQFIVKSKFQTRRNDNVFFDTFDNFIKVNSNRWTNSTLIKINQVRTHLFNFDSKLSLEQLSEAKLISYVNFLIGKKDMRNTTVNRHIRYLKWFLRWCEADGKSVNAAYKGYKTGLTTTKKKVIFLTWDELKKIKNCVIPETKEYLLRVRDTFLFACYTGLRHSDLYNLRKSDIIGDRMYITTEKTADNLDIPINKPANNILNKYKDVYFKNDKALPVISVQKMNDYIKELCKLSGINDDIRLVHYKGNQRIETISPKHDLITSHTGRKTFICNSLHLGLSPQTVMKITGHSNYEAMKPYIEITDSDKTIAMSKWDNVNTDKETNNDLLEQLKEIPKEELLKLLSEMNIEANMEPQASATPDKPIAPKNKKKQADSVKQTRLFD